MYYFMSLLIVATTVATILRGGIEKSNASELKVDFMNKTYGSAGFTKGKGFTSASLRLKNSDQMVFILPDEGVTPHELIASPEKMKLTFEGGEIFNGEVVWKIPKFSFGSALH